MLIAITATKNSLQAAVDSRFGRAAYYMIVNTETGEVKAHDNSDGVNASNGAGTGAAQTLAEYGVQALYTGGQVGPKAADVLNRAGIPYHENISGTVQELLNRLDPEQPGSVTPPAPTRPAAASPPPDDNPQYGMGRGMGMGGGRGQGMGRGMGMGGGRGQGMGRGMGMGGGRGQGMGRGMGMGGGRGGCTVGSGRGQGMGFGRGQAPMAPVPPEASRDTAGNNPSTVGKSRYHLVTD